MKTEHMTVHVTLDMPEMVSNVQTSMNVKLATTTATLMLHVPTTMAATIAHVKLDMKEMVSDALISMNALPIHVMRTLPALIQKQVILVLVTTVSMEMDFHAPTLMNAYPRVLVMLMHHVPIPTVLILVLAILDTPVTARLVPIMMNALMKALTLAIPMLHVPIMTVATNATVTLAGKVPEMFALM
jgi:hypothetical protein